MNLAMLATLSAILERGSFAAAAQQVGCTPSAVSLQVRQMENWFGQPLFDRSTRAVRPTALALQVAAVAREFSGQLEGLRSRPAFRVAGRLRLGAIATIQTDALPQALRWLRERHPGLEVAVLLQDSDALLAELKAGRLDACVLIRPLSGGSSRLLWHNLARQRFVMLVPPGTEPASPRELLQRHDHIRYDTALTGGRIAAKYVRETWPQARAAMDVRAIDAIVAMVSAGLGVAVVPKPRQALLDGHGVRALDLGPHAPTRQIALVRRAGDADSRNVDAVQAAFEAAYAQA